MSEYRSYFFKRGGLVSRVQAAHEGSPLLLLLGIVQELLRANDGSAAEEMDGSDRVPRSNHITESNPCAVLLRLGFGRVSFL